MHVREKGNTRTIGVAEKISFKQQDCQMKEGIENKARMFVVHNIAGMHSTITDLLRIARI